jgi:hypothetical protein
MLGLLAAAVVTRYGALGDASYWEDEQLFFHIGLRVAQGAIPYVDVWDRKPPGLFLLYARFAKVWPSPWGFQLAALAAAWGTALALALMARGLTGREMAGWVAGVLYLVALLLFDGRSGEAGVFGNLLMAWAAWLVISRPGVRRGCGWPCCWRGWRSPSSRPRCSRASIWGWCWWRAPGRCRAAGGASRCGRRWARRRWRRWRDGWRRWAMQRPSGRR